MTFSTENVSNFETSLSLDDGSRWSNSSTSKSVSPQSTHGCRSKYARTTCLAVARTACRRFLIASRLLGVER